MRTAIMTFFTILLLGTALAASALGAIGSPGADAPLDVIPENGVTQRQVHGSPHALPPVVLIPPTSGLPPVTVLLPPTSGLTPVTVLLPPTSGAAPVRLPSTSTAPSSALLGILVVGAGMASGLTLLVMARHRR